MSFLLMIFILLKFMFNALFIISIFMPGMLAILAPDFVAFSLAFVCVRDFAVGHKTTSCFFISSATYFGGSAPCALGIVVRISFDLCVIFNELLHRALPIAFNLESVITRQLSFFFRFMHCPRIMPADFPKGILSGKLPVFQNPVLISIFINSKYIKLLPWRIKNNIHVIFYSPFPLKYL